MQITQLHYSTWQRDNQTVEKIIIQDSEQIFEGLCYEYIYKHCKTSLKDVDFRNVHLDQMNDFSMSHPTLQVLTFINCHLNKIMIDSSNFKQLKRVVVSNCTGQIILSKSIRVICGTAKDIGVVIGGHIQQTLKNNKTCVKNSRSAQFTNTQTQ